jgi:hypothetical protein
VTATPVGPVERLTEALTADYLEYHGLLPLRREGGAVVVATWLDAPDVQALDDLRLIFEGELRLVRSPEDDVRQLIRRLYGDQPLTAEQTIADIAVAAAEGPGPDAALDDLVALAGEAPVVA